MSSKNKTQISKRSAMLATAIVGASLLLTSCSGTGQVKVEGSSSAEASVSSSAKASAPAKPNGVVVSTDKGKYLQVSLPEDYPAYKQSPKEIEAGVSDVYSPGEIAEGTKAGIDYVIRYIIDPPVIDGESDRDAWWSTVKQDFVPEYAQDFRDSLGTVDPETMETSSPVIENSAWADLEYKGFSYIYKEDENRIKNLSVIITKVGVLKESANDLVVVSNVSYEVPAAYDSKVNGEPNADGSKKKAIQHSSGDITLALRKDASGKWLISGWDLNVSNPVTDELP